MTLLSPPTSPTTVVETRPSEAVEVRRATGVVRGSDVLAVLGSAVAALALTAALFTYLLPFAGLLGFVVVAYLVFLALYVLLVSLDESGPVVRDRLAQVVVQSLAVVLLGGLVVVVGYTLVRGRQALPNLNFYLEDLSDTGPLDPITRGGVVQGIVGTLTMITIALAVTVPLGLTCAVYLNEVPGKASRTVRTVVEAMTALPSIVCGLFILATLIQALGVDKSGFAASMAISVMMLPIIIRAADVVLRLVPGSLKEASLALGAGRWRTVWHVVLPTSRSGLATAVILGTARGIGETSPVLLTAGYTASLNTNPFEGPMVSLPLVAFNLVSSPSPEQISRGFGAAALLMFMVLVLFVVARALGGRQAGALTPRQARRRARTSSQDAQRFAERMPAPAPRPDGPPPSLPSTS